MAPQNEPWHQVTAGCYPLSPGHTCGPKGCLGCPLGLLLFTPSAAEDRSCWGKEG